MDFKLCSDTVKGKFFFSQNIIHKKQNGKTKIFFTKSSKKHFFLSGFGGQVDFIRGAALSHDGLGKPIIALASSTKKGVSKIIPYIKQGKYIPFSLI